MRFKGLLLVFCFLAGCAEFSSQPPAPVVEIDPITKKFYKPKEKRSFTEHKDVVPQAKKPVKKTEAPSFSGQWVWPVNGRVIRSYSAHANQINKGIDIAGEQGIDVHAVASGKVVYSGTGLRGYGQLVIIKHNDTYLSAYAHNSRLLVKEGQNVAQGQVIAEMGRTDTDKVKLHFEIRKNGQPINPLTVLPKR